MITTKFRFVESSGEPLEERKKLLRGFMKERRGNNENRDVKEVLLTENCLAAIAELFPETAGAGARLNAFVYLSFSSEAPTDGLIEALLSKGFHVYCPRVEGDELVAAEYGEELTLSDRGIREPAGAAFEGKIALAIVPLLAVDKQGNRLGYGRGYYDKWLKKNRSVKKIGYCFDFQVMEAVPADERDIPLDLVVTDKRVFFTE